MLLEMRDRREMMKCERCGGSGKYFQENPDCSNCPSKDECDDFGKQFCTVPSDCPNCLGTGTKPEPDCINPDCVGGWMAEHEDLTELTIPCSRCNADRHKAKPFFAPKVIVHPRQPEPEQDVIMRQFEKCWHGVFDHLDKMLLIQITDVFRSGYKSGYTSRNAEIEALNETHELETKGRDELRRADVDCILRLREENRKQTEEIEALKVEIESMRCCGNCGSDPNPIKHNLSCQYCKYNLLNKPEWRMDDNWKRRNKSETQPRNNPTDKSNN